MTKDPIQPILLREILVAIDTSAHSHAALEAAAALAKKLEAKIRGLYVQDERWSLLNRLPSARTINELTGDVYTLEDIDLEKQINRLKQRLRRRLEHVSERNRISHSWNTVRGKVEDKILSSAQDADLITIGLKGSSFPRQKKLGSTARAIIQKAQKPVLILKEGIKLEASVTVVYDASKTSQKALKLGHELAQKNDSLLSIVVVDNNPDVLEQRNKELEKMLETSSVSIDIKLIKNADVWNMLHNINYRRIGLLIIPKDQPLIKNYLKTLFSHLNCPLLIMS